MLFNVVGTIASGKTTLINSLSITAGTKVFQEPVHEWKEYFDALNQNFCPETIYALQEKIFEYYHSVLVHFKENPCAIALMERSHMENIYCFILPITLGFLYGEHSTEGIEGGDKLLRDIMRLVDVLIEEHKELKSLTNVSPIYLPTLTPRKLVERKNKRNQPNDKYLSEDFFKQHTVIYKKFINIFGLYEDPCLDDESILELFPNARDLESIRKVYLDFFEKCEIKK